MTEREQIAAKIQEIEKTQIEPLQKRLTELYREDSKLTEEKVARCQRSADKFEADELVFAAAARCACGAGLAYPKKSGTHGSWYCSDILMGNAKPKTDPDSKMHDAGFPFAFYEIKSENQPSANGATTRPK